MKVLVASSICPEAIKRLNEQHDVVCAFNQNETVLQSLIRDREILVFRSGVRITADVMQAAPDLKLLIRAGSGTDNVDLEYVEKRGLHFCRVSEPGAQAVAEMSFALMLALARNLLRADSLTRKGRWAKEQLEGFSLAGKTLGIVGAGNIGTRVGQLGAAWGMKPIGCVESPTPPIAAQLRKNGIRLLSFEEVLSCADFLTVHVPLTGSTRNLINAAALSLMKQGSFLVNLARGGVVDEEALYLELAEGKRLRGAALDVHEHEGEGNLSPLANLTNVILTPHIGAMTRDAQREIGCRINHIVDAFLGSSLVFNERNTAFAFGVSPNGSHAA